MVDEGPKLIAAKEESDACCNALAAVLRVKLIEEARIEEVRGERDVAVGEDFVTGCLCVVDVLAEAASRSWPEW